MLGRHTLKVDLVFEEVRARFCNLFRVWLIIAADQPSSSREGPGNDSKRVDLVVWMI